MDKKIVFITGVSRGIGLEIAKNFVNDGYFVIGTSRGKFDLSNELSSDNCIHLSVDVTNRDQVSSCLDELKSIDKIPYSNIMGGNGAAIRTSYIGIKY